MNLLINSGRTAPYLTTRRKLIAALIAKGHSVFVTGYQEGYEKEIEELGARFIKVPLNRAGFNPFTDLKLLINYYRIIKKKKIDLIHSYTIKPNIYGSIAARLCGVKQVYPTLNGIGYAFTGKGFKAKFTRLIASNLYRLAFKCSKKVFFHNHDDVDLMVRSGLVKRRKTVVTLGSGINMEHYKRKAFPDKISFLLISRLLKAKGVMEYLKAAEKVSKKYPEIEFNLVGPVDPNPTGIKLNEIQEFINQKIIIYHGEQPDVRTFLHKTAVYVLPSYREGVPLSVLEAMSTGRAILVTDVPGCRETVENGKNGFAVEPYNAEALAEKMSWMIENPGKVKEMGNNSLVIAKEKFEVSRVNSLIMETMNL